MTIPVYVCTPPVIRNNDRRLTDLAGYILCGRPVWAAPGRWLTEAPAPPYRIGALLREIAEANWLPRAT